MATKKQKRRLQKRKKATKAVKALGRRRENQLVDWLYEAYCSHYEPEIHYQQYVQSYDEQVVRSVYGRCKFKNYNISYDDLETFYGMRRKRFRKRQAREYQRRLEQQCVRVTFLGTSNANAMNNYNTCFTIRDHKKTFLVDCGGGQYLLRQLDAAQVGLNDIHDIFITHRHLDHILGIYFLLRDLRRRKIDGKYEGELRIFGPPTVIETIKNTINYFMPNFTNYFDDFIKLIIVKPGESFKIIGQEVTFFDTYDKTEQYGFVMKTKNGVSLAYLGDVPLVEEELPYVQGVDYLIHEAFCKQADEKLFKPHRRGHSTLKDACENFKKTNARYLIIVHTEDRLKDKRGPQFRHEAAVDHHTSIMVPEDLETIFLKRPSKQRSYFDKGETTPEDLTGIDSQVRPDGSINMSAVEALAADAIIAGESPEDAIVDTLIDVLSRNEDSISETTMEFDEPLPELDEELITLEDGTVIDLNDEDIILLDLDDLSE